MQQAKLNAYTRGDNTLLSTFGLPAEYRQYRALDVARRSTADYLYVGDGWMDQARGELKTARALPGGAIADVDTAAGALLASLDTLLTRVGGLKAYYESKAYKDDGLARGRREDPLLLGDYKAAMAAMERFEAALRVHRDARADRELAALKAHGDLLGYDTKLSIRQARTVIALFRGTEDLRDPALLKQADTGVAALERTLADQGAQLARAKQREVGAQQGRDLQYGMAADSLNAMIGHYRDLKRSGSGSDYNAAVSDFNSAVGSVNAAIGI